MIAAILAVVGAIIGLVGGVVQSSTARVGQIRANNQARVDYERGRTIKIYDAVKAERTTLLVVCGLGMAFIVVIYYFSKKNK
jgi:hypothetical protein